MASQSSLKEAADEGHHDVLAQFNAAANVATIYDNFLSDVAGILDAEIAGNRAVLNWVTVGYARRAEIQDAQSDQTLADVAVITDLLYFLLRAANHADSESRITSSQASAILTAYNNRW